MYKRQAILSNGTSGSQTTISGSSALSRDTWHHIALSRAASNNWGLYADGSRIAHSTTSVTLPRVRNDWTLCGTIPGAGGVSYHDFLGECYIDNLRITRGIGYYSGTTYTVPTAAFLKPSIKPDPNADVTHSTAQKKIGRSSIAFDGTGDMLEIPGYGQHKFDFWDDNWTMECWARLNTVGARQGILTLGTEADRGWRMISFHNTNGWNVSRDMESNVNNFSITEGSVSASINTWYHLALVRNGSTITFYVDGVQTGTPVTGVSGNFLTEWASYSDDQGRHLTIGAQYNDSGVREDFFNGYLDEIRISKVARYTSNNFTPPTTQFTEDANTVLLIHSDYDGGLGHDSSGQNNHFTKSGLTNNDQYVDTPTNNFCVWNPLSTAADYGECNTKVITTVAGSAPYKQAIYASMSWPTTSGGKWYWEVDVINVAGLLGIGASCTESTNRNRHNQVGGVAGVNIYVENGNAYIGGTTYGSQPTYGVGDIISVAVDEDNNKIYFAKNNTWLNSANPSAGTNGWTLSSSGGQGFGTPLIVNDHTGSNVGVIANFGQDSAFAGAQTDQNGGNTDSNGEGDFYYTPPTGFLALCTKNLRLKIPPGTQPKKNYNTVLYTGGSGAQTRSVGFAPDMVWIKNRGQSQQWSQWDSVRGVNKLLSSDRTTAESSETNIFNAFTNDGFTHGSDSLVAASNPYGSFSWKGGGAATNNTAGDITSSVSANPDAGISIVTYTGNGSNAQTVGHGLGAMPSAMIVRPRNYADHWFVYHAYVGSSKYLYLDGNDAVFTSNIAWSNTDPTSSVFTIGTSSPATGGGQTYNYIAYCFREIPGFSRFGKWTGTGSADAGFVYFGFRPAWVLIKRLNQAEDWYVVNDKSAPYNETDAFLKQSDVIAEASGLNLDLVSNGLNFKSTEMNVHNVDYIYMAFAAYPFTHTNAR